MSLLGTKTDDERKKLIKKKAKGKYKIVNISIKQHGLFFSRVSYLLP